MIIMLVFALIFGFFKYDPAIVRAEQEYLKIKLTAIPNDFKLRENLEVELLVTVRISGRPIRSIPESYKEKVELVVKAESNLVEVSSLAYTQKVLKRLSPEVPSYNYADYLHFVYVPIKTKTLPKNTNRIRTKLTITEKLSSKNIDVPFEIIHLDPRITTEAPPIKNIEILRNKAIGVSGPTYPFQSDGVIIVSKVVIPFQGNTTFAQLYLDDCLIADSLTDYLKYEESDSKYYLEYIFVTSVWAVTFDRHLYFPELAEAERAIFAVVYDYAYHFRVSDIITKQTQEMTYWQISYSMWQ